MQRKPGKTTRGKAVAKAVSRKPLSCIGDFLVGIDQISSEQAGLILDHQTRRPCKLFGELAVELGFVKDKTVRGYLTRKSFI
jgi:hypothetical protein